MVIQMELNLSSLQRAEVRMIDHKTARPFIEKWHYSHKVPTGKNIFFGWFVDGNLYAVADYGIGVNPFQAQFLSRSTNEDVTNEKLLELKRLCRIEPKNDTLQLTQFIAKCHKKLKQMGYRYVVSFSDPARGHNGGIYKAANFQHLGTSNAEFHDVDEHGEIHHRRYAFRYARRKGVTIAEARLQLGLKRQKTPPKDRWFIKI